MSLKRLFDIRRWLPSHRRTLEEIDEEFSFHLQERALDSEAEGMELAEAHRDAERRFGDARHYREQGEKVLNGHARKRARASFVEGLAQNLGVAIRTLRRRPGFTAAAVLTLAIAIGANAAMFGVIKTVVLGPLPFEAPDRVVQLWEGPPIPGREHNISLGNLRDYEDLDDVFSHVAALEASNMFSEQGGYFEFVAAHFISSDLFEMMGVVPTAGRTFRAEEDLESVGRVVLLTHAYWLRKFGGEEVIGKTITLEQARGGGGLPQLEYEIIGVLPPDFRTPPVSRSGSFAYGSPEAQPNGQRVWTQPDVILPMGQGLRERANRRNRRAYALAQLHDGVTPEQARASLQFIAEGIVESEPRLEGLEITVAPVEEVLRQEYGLAMGFLWAATALVLLVACASVSSLLLGWGVAREQELAVRAALGAGARRLFSQLLTEAMVLAVAAGALGVLLAYWGIAAVKVMAPAGVYRLDQISLDLGVLGFALGAALVTVLLVGLWPALRGAGRPSSEVLKAGGRGATLARTRSLRVLVTAEVALSLVLLAGAGLMLQSFWNLVGVDTGIASTESLVNVNVRQAPGSATKYAGDAAKRELFLLVRDRVEAIPGVISFTASNWNPERPVGNSIGLTLVDRPLPPGSEGVSVDWRFVSPGFFRTMGIQLLEGRVWDEGWWRAQDLLGLNQVVISEGTARLFWPGESAVGKIYVAGDVDPDFLTQSLDAWRRRQPGDPLPQGQRPSEVIGVVADASLVLGQEPIPTGYVADAFVGPNFFIRTARDPAEFAAVLRREIDAIDPNEIQVSRIRTMEQFFAEGSADSRFRALLVVFFAVMATVITCLGLFGVLAYAVAQRTRELGIRMALGAARSDIAGLVLRQGARMTGLGVAVGFALVFWLMRYISSLLFGVVPLDLTTLLGAAALIFLLALVASYLPARRAMRVDPIESLREG